MSTKVVLSVCHCTQLLIKVGHESHNVVSGYDGKNFGEDIIRQPLVV